jgi:hypothetical protein
MVTQHVNAFNVSAWNNHIRISFGEVAPTNDGTAAVVDRGPAVIMSVEVWRELLSCVEQSLKKYYEIQVTEGKSSAH